MTGLGVHITLAIALPVMADGCSGTLIDGYSVVIGTVRLPYGFQNRKSNFLLFYGFKTVKVFAYGFKTVKFFAYGFTVLKTVKLH